MKSTSAFAIVVALFACGARAAAAQDQSSQIYDEDVVATFQLTMSAADWDKIVNDPHGQGDIYWPATMVWQGETVTQVGVKATGKASRKPGNPKPALKIKFDEFVPSRQWKGVDMVRLDSLKLDYSAMRDRLAYWVYRQAGANAPRSVNARLIVNGSLKGLYEVEEPIRKAFARFRWSGGAGVDGNLYEIDYADENGNGHPQGTDQYLWRGGTPGTYVPKYWHPETNSIGGNYQDVVNLVNVLNNAQPAQRRTQLEALINLDSFLEYLAVTTVLSNFDSIFSWGIVGSNTPNNHYWYHREDTNRMEIVAWDVENSFGNQYFTTNPPTGVGSGQYRATQDIWFGFNSTWATSWIQAEAGVNSLLRSKIEQVLNGPLSGATAKLNFIVGQIRPHVVNDPYKPFSMAQFDAEVQNVRDWISRRIAYLRAQFPNTTNNAAFVSQSVPTSMTAGQTYPVSVRMRNTGTTTWTTSNYALGSQNPTDNQTWGMNRVQLAAGESIGVNQEKVFSWTVTAPATAGTYNFRWQMRQSGVAWFGALSPNVSVTVTTTPTPASNNAQFISHTVPASLAAGSTATVTIAMKNTGTSTWSGSAVNRYALGHSAGATPWTWRERRVWLAAGETVAPNATKTFSFTITAPSTPGTYAFPQWRMIEDGIAYFGTSSPALNINVTGGSPTAVTKAFQEGVSPTSAYVGARDTYVTRDAPTSNFGTAAGLTVDGDTTGTGNDARALLRWYVTDIPSGSTVQSAKIKLHVTNSSTQTYELFRVYRYWSEAQATWNVAQTGTSWQIAGADGSTDRGQTVRGAVTAAATGTVTITLNSTGVSMVQAWVNDPASNFGVILLDSANTDGLGFASKESATPGQRPRLEVTYAPPGAVLAWEETAPADSVIEGGENPLTLEDALGEAASPAADGDGGGGGGGTCGALGLEALLLLALTAAFRRRGA